MVSRSGLLGHVPHVRIHDAVGDGHIDAAMRWVVERGSFEARVGSSSTDIGPKDRFDIVR
jgi:hypothetical protein